MRGAVVTCVLALGLMFGCGGMAAGQNSAQITEQKRVIADLEKKIAAQEQEITKLRKGRASSEEQVRRLARQINSRTQLLDATEREAGQLQREIARKDSVAGDLATRLERGRAQYAEMVREAYRNYRHNNYLTYLFSARDFADVARRLANLRAVAAVRGRKLAELRTLGEQLRTEQQELGRRRESLDSVARRITAQRAKLERDTRNARANISNLSKREKAALRRKEAQEQELDAAIAALRKLTKGNKEGASFTARTSGLHLPVVGGRVKRYKENMAEITGAKGARVISIYEGKVVEVKRNRITDKYDVFVAHGEYITSYANLGTVRVTKGQKVGRDETLGTVGASVDIGTMETEYRLVFGIYPPDPKQRMSAANCFKR